MEKFNLYKKENKDYKIFIFDTKKNTNEYFKSNTIKYIEDPKKNSNNLFLTIKSNIIKINKTIYDNLNKYNFFTILLPLSNLESTSLVSSYMNKLEKTLKNISTILLPLIQLDKKNNLYIITLSPIIFLQLNGLPNHHKYNNSFLIVFL